MVELTEKVERNDRIEIDDHDHKQSGHHQLAYVVEDRVKDRPESFEVSDEVKEVDGEVEDVPF